MKKFCLIIFIGISLCYNNQVNSQGLGINSSGNSADPSAILDANSTSKGQLVPRMTSVQRNAISNPAQSLLIYNTTTRCYEFYDYGMWQTLGCATCPTTIAPTEG